MQRNIAPNAASRVIIAAMVNDGVDLNLLVALDALLVEGSVTGAARRLGLSTSAMSRTLTRLRVATGDPLLVRAGRGLVPTPRADALRERVHELTREARATLRPSLVAVDPATLTMSFTVRVSEVFLELLAGPVANAIMADAPQLRLRFAAKPDKEAGPLRDGSIDLEIGVIGTTAPEIRTRTLMHDHLVGVVRGGHPLLDAPVTPQTYAACRHVVASRTPDVTEAVDAGLASHGLTRRVAVVVPGYPDAMRIARQSDLVALVPFSCLGHALPGSQMIAAGLQSFELPLPAARFRISAMWHPRMDADPAHRWVRERVMAVCRVAYPRRSG